jgi:pyruvate dehydrogenase E2 component (dihydrolipoyllysine-residue acetyltransferase)
MAISVVMPALEMAQETGRLIAWRKREGESVAKGETLLEVETDKAVMEIEAPGDGILAGVRVREGSEVPVGQTIAWIVRPGEAPPKEVSPSEIGGRTMTSPLLPVSPGPTNREQPAGATPEISPKARRLAREHGVDLGRLHGSGPGGRILAEDILAARAAQTTPVPAGEENLSPVGRLMAERTTRSWTTVPHFYLVRDVDAGALLQARTKMAPAIEKTHGIRPTLTDLLTALVARVLRRHPRVNASWNGNRIRLNHDVNIAIAVAVDAGVVAAVIHNADRSDVAAIGRQRQQLAERARAGRLRTADVAGATFTISNLGMYNVDAFSAIITPPQAATLAVGQIADRVVPVEGQPGIRPMMTMTLSADHRVADGAKAAAFLNDLAQAIQEPESHLP